MEKNSVSLVEGQLQRNIPSWECLWSLLKIKNQSEGKQSWSHCQMFT